ncbi:MAG: hypothetical protein SNJ52_01010 [Verrucomicrobiia bacterium]
MFVKSATKIWLGGLWGSGMAGMALCARFLSILVSRETALLVSLGLALAACSPQPPDPRPDLIVLHTARLRGNIYPPSLQSGAPLQYYPKLAGYIRSVRAEAAAMGAKVLTVDLGDSFFGSFPAYATQGAIMAEFFKAAEYDALFLGNLDMDVSEDLRNQVGRPILTPFVNETGEPLPQWASTAEILAIGPIRVGLAANFYGDLDQRSAPQRFPTTFGGALSGVRPLRSYANLFADPKPNLSILSWMKFEPTENPPEAFLAHLAESGFDLSLAHRIYSADIKDAWSKTNFFPWKPPVAQNILRENRGFTISRTDLKAENGGWKVLKHQLIPVNSLHIADDEVRDLIERIERFAPAITAANSVLCTLDEPVSEEALLTAIVRALATVEGATAATYSINSIRGKLESGELKASRLYEALPWTGPLVRLRLTRDQLEAVAHMPHLEVLMRDEEPPGNEPNEGNEEDGADKPIQLVTGRFLGMLIQSALKLPMDKVTTLDGTTEFGFFREAFAAKASTLLAEEFPGWSRLSHP